MTSGERLMILFEKCGYDIKKYKLKKQIEFEKNGNFSLYKINSLEGLLKIYNQDVNESKINYFKKNPLTYTKDWDQEIKSIDEFVINHPDLAQEMVLKDFINDDSFDEIMKESILYDIFDEWVEEYREYSISRMENMEEMFQNLPKKKKYRRPSKSAFILSVLLGVLILLVYKNPDVLIFHIFKDYNFMLYKYSFYSFFGFIVTLLLVCYAVVNNGFSGIIRDITKEKKKKTNRLFITWKEELKKSRLKQSGIIEDYVDLVQRDQSKSYLDIKSLMQPEKTFNRVKSYVNMIESRYDWMMKNYSKIIKYLRMSFLITLFLYVSFFVIGYFYILGWF